MAEGPSRGIRTSIGVVGGGGPAAAEADGRGEVSRREGAVEFGRGVFEVFTDGCSRGNPGKSGAGYVIGLDDQVIEEGSRYLGVMTNNQAEYRAFLIALERCLALGIGSVRVKSDSQLLVNQINGSYRVRKVDLMPLHHRAVNLLHRFADYRVEYVSRDENRRADKLAGNSLKKKGKR